MKKQLALVLLLSLLCVGCKTTATGSYASFKTLNRPLLGEIANKSIEYEGVERNPVIVVPGIFGSRLVDSRTNKVIWGQFETREAITGLDKWRVEALILPMAMESSLFDLRDHLISDGPIKQLEVQLGILQVRLGAYGDMIEALREAGYHDEKGPNKYNKKFFTCFPFGYDWRRDIVENAAKLHLFILEKRAYLQRKYEELYGIKDYDVQFDIVAHSMGGLVSRYYLRYGDQDLPEDGFLPEITWKGSHFVDKVIIIGAPNAGYLDAFIEHINGLTFTQVGADRLEPAVLGTFPSLYELMPVTSFNSIRDKEDPDGAGIDIYDVELWKDMQWGIMSPKEKGFLKKMVGLIKEDEHYDLTAYDHLNKCLNRAKHFQEALAIPASPPDDVSLQLFLSSSFNTSRVATVDRDNGKIKVIKYGPGDGKVLTSSALYDMREGQQWVPFSQTPIDWSAIKFSYSAHMGITNDQNFLDNLIYMLLETQTRDFRIKKEKA